MTDPTDMIERVARAIRGFGDFDDISFLAKKAYRKEARAAIEAMREMTPTMRAAGAYYLGTMNTSPAWHAMIDAALGKEP
jgi:hypothetical protein